MSASIVPLLAFLPKSIPDLGIGTGSSSDAVPPGKQWQPIGRRFRRPASQRYAHQVIGNLL